MAVEWKKLAYESDVLKLSGGTMTGDIVMTSTKYIGLSGAGRVIFTDAATDVIQFSSCNVGIGKETPDGLLHLYNASGGALAVIQGYSTLAWSAGLRFVGETVETWYGGYVQYDAGANIFILGTHNTADKTSDNDLPQIQLARAGGITLRYATTANIGLIPDANDGAYLGTSALGWSDLFLASGGVINWNNGDVTLTHASDLLTLASGYFKNTYSYEPKLEVHAGGVRSFGSSGTYRKVFKASNSPFKRSSVNYYATGICSCLWFIQDANGDFYGTMMTDNAGDDYITVAGLFGDLAENLDVYLVEFAPDAGYRQTIITNASWADFKAYYDAFMGGGADVDNESGTEGVDAYVYTNGAYVFTLPSGWTVADNSVETWISPATLVEHTTPFIQAGFDLDTNIFYLQSWREKLTSDKGSYGVPDMPSPTLRFATYQYNDASLEGTYSYTDLYEEAISGSSVDSYLVIKSNTYENARFGSLGSTAPAMSFFGATPVIQQDHIANAVTTGVWANDDDAIVAAINYILTAMENYGLLKTA